MKFNEIEISANEIVLEEDNRFLYSIKREDGDWVARLFDGKGTAIGERYMYRNDLIEWLGTQPIPNQFILSAWNISLVVAVDRNGKSAMIMALYGGAYVQHAIIDEAFVPSDVTPYGVRYTRVQQDTGLKAVDFLLFYRAPSMPESVAESKLKEIRQEHTQTFYNAVKAESERSGINLTVNGTVLSDLMSKENITEAVILRVSDITDAPCENKPELLIGKPIGMHHCYVCGDMVMAGMPHPPRDAIL